MTESIVYHFTDTMRLPWIIETGELRPNTSRIGDFPPDFLWATTDQNGDRTSSAASSGIRKLWRDGQLQLIRFILKATDFGDWEEAATSSGWPDEQVEALKKAAVALGEPETTKWRCRPDPLPISNVLRVEAKSYFSGRWTLIDANRESCVNSDTDPNFRAFIIGDFAYGAIRKSGVAGTKYEPVRRFAAQPSNRFLRA